MTSVGRMRFLRSVSGRFESKFRITFICILHSSSVSGTMAAEATLGNSWREGKCAERLHLYKTDLVSLEHEFFIIHPQGALQFWMQLNESFINNHE
ncbi:unnamed protein product [Linum trigynum]|uniref:Secreted protein n=1 Tax=Linum trigynum TaxID=586398 RepID=A0AAV2GVK2_9ROSI